MKEIRVTLPGAPRTKKTSNRVIPVGKRHIVLPSEAYEAWHKAVLTHAPQIKGELRKDGIEIPIAGPVEVEIDVYREAEQGDLPGFTSAIADTIQAGEYLCGRCNRKVLEPYGNQHWAVCRDSARSPKAKGTSKVARTGLGLIEDDKQIIHEDTWLYVDRDNPRVELVIRPLPGGQAKLFGGPAAPPQETAEETEEWKDTNGSEVGKLHQSVQVGGQADEHARRDEGLPSLGEPEPGGTSQSAGTRQLVGEDAGDEDASDASEPSGTEAV